MDLTLETTTGLLQPAGVAPSLPRGDTEQLRLYFQTAGVAVLLPEATAITLDLYAPEDLDTPLVSVTDFTEVAGSMLYRGAFDTLSGGLATLQRGTLLGRIGYEAVDSEWFQLNYGVAIAAPVQAAQAPTATAAVPSPFFDPAFVELTSGLKPLSQLTASAELVGRILVGTVGGELKHYQVRAGTDAQALPGIVRPANFNADTAAFVFGELTFSSNADAAIAAAILAERTAAATLVNKALTNEAETVQILVDGATVEWDLSLGGTAAVTLGGNRAIANPTNARAGATYILEIIQDGTGGRTLTWGDAFVWPSNEAPTLTTAAGKRDIAAFCCRDGKLYGSAVTDFA